MKQPFSYEEFCQEELDFHRLLAQRGSPSCPVYSGDIAAAFQIRHRILKDYIEGQYGELRRAYGKKVRRVAHKRSEGARAMNGYLLPLRAIMQVLYEAGLMRNKAIPSLVEAQFVHLCFSSDRFLDHLN
jgi:hypothetical protein